MIGVAALAGTVAFAAPAVAEEDPFAPLRPLLGAWEGTGDGLGGPAVVEHRYELVLQDRFLHMRTQSVFAGEGGEVHEDWGVFSHDPDAGRLVWRQFLSEGYVNTYALVGEPGSEPMVWQSVSTEGAGGMQARITVDWIGEDEYAMLLELQPPGGEFFDCRRLRLRRVE